MTEYMREHLPDVPMLIAGNGDRVLTVAAKQANIIGLTGGHRSPTRRIRSPSGSISSVGGGRPFDALELNIAITALPRDESGQPDLSITRRACPT